MDLTNTKIHFWHFKKTESLDVPVWVRMIQFITVLYTIIWLFLWALLIHFYIYPFFLRLEKISSLERDYYYISLHKDLKPNLHQKKVEYTKVVKPPETWVKLKDISFYLREAILASEDGKFFEHPGYDIEEIQKAIYTGVVLKKKLRGASTITQQLVKNLFFQTDRSFWRKGQEILLTLWMEEKVSKNKILEIYLNIIEFGDNIYGIKNAAKYYFKKDPKNLNPREASFLAMLLPSPKRYAQSFRKKALTHFAHKRIQSILFKMVQRGHLSFDDYLFSLERRFNWEKGQESNRY